MNLIKIYLKKIKIEKNYHTKKNPRFDVNYKERDQFLIRLDELDLSVRTLNSLTDQGVTTIGTLVFYEEKDLKTFPGMGATSLNEIKDMLNLRSLRLGMEIFEDKDDQPEEIREVRLQCLSGMLLCLTKEQRIIYIIGEVFGADHNIGSEIMDISKANYRMKLSKSRKDLQNFMLNKCGLVNKANPCRCHKKVTIAIETKMINAKNLLFNKKKFSTFKEALEEDANTLVNKSDQIYVELHRDNSFKTDFDKKNFIAMLLESKDWRARLHLN